MFRTLKVRTKSNVGVPQKIQTWQPEYVTQAFIPLWFLRGVCIQDCGSDLFPALHVFTKYFCNPRFLNPYATPDF